MSVLFACSIEMQVGGEARAALFNVVPNETKHSLYSNQYAV
jgi:hypothetical protein